MSRYISPVNPSIYPHLTLLLLGIGVFFTAWFFVYLFIKFSSKFRVYAKYVSPVYCQMEK